jgi:hypothetical protein
MSAVPSMVEAALENFGISQWAGVNRGLISSVTVDVLSKVVPQAGMRGIKRLINAEINNLVLKGATNVVGAMASEFETGALQSISDTAFREAYEIAKGKDLFKQPGFGEEGFKEALLEDAKMEALGGMWMAGASNIAQQTSEYVTGKSNTNETFALMKQILASNTTESALASTLKSQIISGSISKEQAQNTFRNFREAKAIVRELPQELSEDNQRAAFDLLAEKRKLTKQIEGKDPSLVNKQKKRITEIENQLIDISNAVQEQATSEVPVQPEARVGEEVVEGKPQPEPQVVTEEGQVAKEEIEKRRQDELDSVDISKGGKVPLEGYEEFYKNVNEKYDAELAALKSPKDQVQEEIVIDKPTIAVNSKLEVDSVKNAALDVETGQTFNLDGTVYTEGGLVVPIDTQDTTQEELTPELIADFIEKNKDRIGNNYVKVGIYKFADSSKVSIDLNIVVPRENREAALEFGRLSGQESLFDLDTFENIKTGSDGKNTYKFTPDQDVEIANALKSGNIPNVFGDTNFDQAVTNSAQSLKLVAPDLKIIVAENTEDAQLQIAEALSAVAPYQAADVAEGFTTETRGQTVFVNGNPFAIVLDKSQADTVTIGHEVWETLLNDAFGDDQAKFKEFTDSIDSQLRAQGFGDIADALDAFASQKGYEDVKYSEYMAELGGMLVGSGFGKGSLTAQQRTLLQKIGDIINKFAELFTGKKQFLDQASPEDILGFMVTISEKVAKGEDVSSFFRGETPGATMDGGIIAKSQIGPDSVDDQFDMSIQYDDSNMPDKLSMPDVETIDKVLGESGGAAVFINSDGTKVGITRDNKKLQGGWRYTYFKENIDDNIGFAATSETHVGTFHKLIQQIAKERDALNPSMKDKPVAVFVTVQNAESMLGEWYAGEFLMDGIDKAITEKKTTVAKARKLMDTAIVDAQKRYIDSERKLSESKGKTRTLQDIKSDSQYKQLEKLKSIIKEKGIDTHDGRIKAAKVLGSKDFSFKFRSSFLSELIPLKAATGKNQEIKKLLLDVGYGRKDFYKDTMDEVLYDALEKSNFKESSIGGTTLGGFYADPYVTKEAFLKNKNNGIQHEMFNESFSSNGKTFRLDKPRNVNKLFPSMGFPDAKGYSLYNEANNSSESKESGIVGKNKVTKWLLANGYEKNVTNPFTAISGTMYTSTIDADYQKKEPSVKTKAQKVEKIQNETNFVPTSFWVETLKGNIDYLDNVIEHILKARDILKSGEVTQKMTTKSYLITLSSMGSGGGYYDNWKAKTGKTVEDIFIEKQNGREWLRPEGAAAAYLSTKEGKNLVTKINAGTATKDEIKKLFDYVGTGRESSKADYVEKTMQADGLKKMTDLFNENKGSDFSELFDGAIKNLKGIGEGKTGFFNQYFGVSSRGVVDARQMNAWVSGSMKLTEEQKKLKKKIESSPKLQQELLSKIEEVGLELGYPKDLAAYIAHHAIWDAIAQNITKHEGEYIVTRSQKSVPKVVDEVLTDDGKGNYLFVHYSRAKRDTIKPMSGSKENFTSREEVAAISSVGGVAMYYTKQGQKEQGVGDVPHTVLVPKDKVYFYGTTERGKVSNDPENFYPEARRRFQEYKNMNNLTRPTEYAFDSNNAVAWITKVAAENGYDMVVTNWGAPTSYRAQTVKELTPEAEYTGFKQIPEPTYEVGDEVFLYGRYVTLTDVKPDVLSYEYEGGSGKYPLTVMTRDKIIMVQKAKPTVTTRSQRVDVTVIPGYERMMGEVEGIMDKSINRGRSYNQTSANAVDYIQKSSVYERADDSQREQIIRDFKKIRGEKFKVAPSVAKIMGQIKDVKKITVKESTALKDQIKLEVKAAKDSAAFVKQLRMDISGRLKSMVGRGMMSARQATAIIARYDKMNILNPVMRDRFVDYMSRVFQSAEYMDKIKEASKLRASIKKAMKSPANQAEIAKLAKDFGDIDPSRVENIDDYINNATQMLNAVARKTGDPLMRSLVNAADMASYIETEIESQREQIKNELLDKYKELVDAGVLSSDMTINEIKKVIAAIEENDNESVAKEEKAKAAVKEMMAEVSPLIVQIVKTGEDPFTGEPIALTQDEKKSLIALTKMDTDNLSLSEALQVLEYANNFVANGITSGIDGMVSLYQGDLNVGELVKAGILSKVLSKYFSKPVGKVWGEGFATLPMLNKLLWGNTRLAILVSEKAGINGVSNGKAKALKMVDTAVKQYVKQFSKVKDFLSSENVVERGVFAFMSRNVIGDEFQAQDEFNRRKSLIKETIQALTDVDNNTDAEIKKGEVIQKVYDKVLKDAKNINDVKKNVSQISQDAVNWWINKWSENFDRIDEVSRNVYNTQLSRDIDFTPDRYQLKEAPTAVEEDFESGFFGNFEYVDTSKSGSLRKNNRISNLPKDKNGVRKRIVNLDFDVNNVNAFTSAMVDVETASSVMQMKGFVTSKNFSKLFSNKEDKNLYKKRLIKYVNRAKGGSYVDQNELSKINRTINTIASFGVAKALFSVSQPFKQFFPPMINTFVQTGRFDLNKLLYNGGMGFIDSSGYPIANRGVASQGELKSINRQLVEAEKNLAMRGLDGVAEFSNKTLEITLKNPDIFAARASWISFYLSKLKKQGVNISGIDFNTHELNKDAADYAQAMVDSQQNISDTDMQGEIFASKQPATVFLRRAILPLMTFTLNQKTRIWSDVRTLSNDVSSKDDKVEAAKSLSGALIELVAFQGIVLAFKELYNVVAAAIMGEDEDEEEKKIRKMRQSQSTAQAFMKDFFLPPIPGMDILASKGVNYLLDETGLSDELPYKWYGIEDEEQKFRLYDKMNQGYLDMLGTQGIAAEKALELIEYYDAAIDGEFTKEYNGNKVKKALMEEDLDIARMNAVIMTAYYGGVLPSDMANIVNIMNKKIQKRAEQVDED